MENQSSHQTHIPLPTTSESGIKDFGLLILGEPILLRTNSSEMAEILAYFFHSHVTGPLEVRGNRAKLLHLSIPEPSTDFKPASVAHILAHAIQELAVTLNDRFVFIHGCAFIHNGEAIAFCGPSGSGKTTISMVAHHLGYRVLSDDVVAVDWKQRRIYSFPLPFRPRPFTRDLLERWQLSKGKTGSNANQLRPYMGNHGFPLRRLYLASGEGSSNLHTIRKSIFGSSELDPLELVRQINHALADCRIKKCPPVRIAPDIDESNMISVFKQWIQTEEMKCPREIFGMLS